MKRRDLLATWWRTVVNCCAKVRAIRGGVIPNREGAALCLGTTRSTITSLGKSADLGVAEPTRF